MALAIDSSTPALVSTTVTASALTTASFTPPSGALLVVFYMQCFGGTRTMSQPTNTGGSVSWNAAVAVTLQNGNTRTGIWLGKVTSSASMTVTETPSSSTSSWAHAVVVVTGQAATQNGLTNSSSGSPALPSVTLTSLVGSNSLVIGCVAQSSNSTVATAGSNQSTTINSLAFTFSDATNGDAAWVQYDTRMNLASGSNDTLNDSAPNVNNAMAAIEILAPGSAAPLGPPLVVGQSMKRASYF